MNNKPEIGDIYGTKLPKDPENTRKLKGFHPVVIIENNIDDSSRVMGCSSNKADKDDVKLETEPPMPVDTYARKYQGLIDVENKDLTTFKGSVRKCTNIEDLTSGI
jgi:hypothetical protein